MFMSGSMVSEIFYLLTSRADNTEFFKTRLCLLANINISLHISFSGAQIRIITTHLFQVPHLYYSVVLGHGPTDPGLELFRFMNEA